MKKTFRNLSPIQKRKQRRGHRVLSWTLAATSSAVGVQAAPTPVEQSPAPVAGVGAQTAPAMQFSIPAGPLNAALAEFRRVTGLKIVLAEPRIGTVQSPGVSGSMPPERAMEAMLSGTGVAAAFSPDSVRLSLKAVRESIAVTGELPKLESPKYREPLRDTPQTVVVIPQQIFMEQNAASLRDVLRNTPGITMSIGEGGSGGTSSGDNVLIRGFSARNDIYIDGARDPGLVNRDAFDVESVEVVKGPSSATGGRGTTGGSINLVTKAPERNNAGTVRFTGGNGDFKRTTVDLNQRLTDSAAFRLNGMWQDTGYPGRDVAKYRSWGVAPSLTLGLGKPTSVTLSYSRLQQDNLPDWGIPTLLPDVAIAKGVTVNDLNFSNFYGIASRDYEVTRSDHATITLTHKFDDEIILRNLTRYGKNYRDAVLTPPRPATTTTGQGPEDPGYDPNAAQIRRTDTKYQHRNDQLLMNQTDLMVDFHTGKIKHDAEVGMEVSRDFQPTYVFTDNFAFGRPPVDDLFHPTPYVPYTASLVRTGASTDAHATTVAMYAFDTLKFNNHFAIDAGIRWDHVDADYQTVSATGVVAPFARTDTAFTGRAGVNYKPVAAATIYAAYSTSFTPSFDGTLGLTLAATGVNSQTLEPERTRNVEVGAKWDAGKNLGLTFALFDMSKTNAKTTDLNGATVLAGDQNVKGAELGVSGNLTSRWGLFGGLALMNGTVKASGVVTEVGAQLAYVPHASMNFWTTYRMKSGLILGGGMNYNSGHYFNQTGGFLFVSGSKSDPRYVQNAAAIQALTKYWVFNAMASYPFNKHITVQVNGSNLNNAKYADRAYDRHFLPGPTRQVLAGPVITW
jgi:catecholate siderophore receptor